MIVRDYERDSAMSKMIGSVHTTSEEFENGTLFLRLGLPSTLIPDENGAFQKLKEFQNAVFAL